MTQATLICDMQFGSTGKGLLAGYLAERDRPDTIVTAWGPNAGHTYIDGSGRKYIHTMLANGIVSPNLERVLIGPGSVVNVDNLMAEIEAATDVLNGRMQFEGIYIHEHAAIVTQEHRDIEAETMMGIGSTAKGTGVCNSQKMARPVFNAPVAKFDKQLREIEKVQPFDFDIRIISQDKYISLCNLSEVMQIEGAQGYSLGINSGFYPYVTSRECTPRQILTDCGIPGVIQPKVIGTMRTYPIRVANRYDEDGNEIGTSGPGYPDQREMSWEDVGVNPELTTVTKLPRRIFRWSWMQFHEAVQMCAPDEIFLNFTNYLDQREGEYLMDEINRRCDGILRYAGGGPTVDDVYDLWEGAL